jgi:hypothetical protein
MASFNEWKKSIDWKILKLIFKILLCIIFVMRLSSDPVEASLIFKKGFFPTTINAKIMIAFQMKWQWIEIIINLTEH